MLAYLTSRDDVQQRRRAELAVYEAVATKNAGYIQKAAEEGLWGVGSCGQ